MRYRDLYGPKPFPDATLLFYDNGLYAILSEGENHYGTYVIGRGDFGHDEFEIDFISLPSADWNGRAVRHELRFDCRTVSFVQQLTNPDDPNVAPQRGTFTITANPVADPTTLTWEHARQLGVTPEADRG
ncbi:hypothetical protein NDR87_03585 [Nocardia sp. CDC159]|uniref:Uncharacterized protein n=1 Tax=Nocardia pulmonis TaxID=2951408 RepID=A0A9X2E0R8_9NOCA|nr:MULTISPECIES: hypothetical protein [Nocardia]MCM6771902.1 hypothetical protein [Nocardia pulmonis]MCM6785440.1 hypothetical protein [Nocardia sp. CDC159]